MSDKYTYSQFACIGTGFSGIALGCTVKRWYGISDIRFFEKESDLGGTWFVNQYPGCACDVPSVLYSLSFAPNPEWTTLLAGQQEIWQYLNRVAVQYGLREKMTFNSTVERCEWIEETSRWRITVRDNASDTIFIHESQFLFSAAGVLVHPRKPNLPNIDSFEGPVFHAAEWRHDVDLTGKNVAVIGNGCSAAQIVPAIEDRVKHVTQFARSKQWVVAVPPAPNTALYQWLFMNVPGVLAFVRWIMFLQFEEGMKGFFMTKAGAAVRKLTTATATKHLRDTVPEKYHDKLIPDFEIGCKRRVFDMGYLESLNSERVTFRNDAIEEVTPTGIRSKDGFTEADIIVYATGFETNSFCTNIEVVGRGGVTAEEHWSSLGGPGAYNSTSLAGFPNFFMILGPNTLTGHTSTIMAAENSINYALRVIKPVIQGQATAVDVKLDAEKQYTHQVQTDLTGMVWHSGCNSWYNRSKNGVVRNASMYPYTQPYFWYKCLFPTYRDFTYDIAKNPPRRIWKKAVQFLVCSAASVVGLRLIISGTKDIWDLKSYVPFVQDQARVFGKGVVAAYVKMRGD
ncbi:hypothetical protein V8C35DRAFT_150824 [Trichoderma chlorosporum]